MVARGGRGEQVGRGQFWDRETALCDAVVVGRRHHTSVTVVEAQHRERAYCKRWTPGDSVGPRLANMPC